MRHGSQMDPPNRFSGVRQELDGEYLDWDQEFQHSHLQRDVQYLADTSQSIVATNDSPDIPFRYSINPYRGCVHGCAYCYARNTHEYLGFNAGLDFETRILVKHDAPGLFRDFLANDRWAPAEVVFSGVTDCYQPAEREYRLTRGCLEVAAECRLPIGIVTKNALIVRDRDLLAPMAAQRLVHANISITTLDPELARVMEPRTSTPAARLRAIRELSAVGVPTRVMVAPIIPGLNDAEIPAILAAAAEAGAQSAGCILLRLPLTVAPVFREWLQRERPSLVERVEGRLREARGGQWYDAEWGTRMKGSGPIAEQINNLFRVFSKRHGLEGKLPEHDLSLFQPAQPRTGQRRLFQCPTHLLVAINLRSCRRRRGRFCRDTCRSRHCRGSAC